MRVEWTRGCVRNRRRDPSFVVEGVVYREVDHSDSGLGLPLVVVLSSVPFLRLVTGTGLSLL